MTEQITPAAPTITALFARAIDRWADRVAFRVKVGDEWQPITFAEYGEAVRVCAGGLIGLGLAAGDFGAIMSTNRPEWHIADFGLINAGLVSCPVYPTSAPAQVRYILRHSAARIVIVEDEAQRQKIDEIRKDLPDLRHCVVFTGEGCDGEFYLGWDDLLADGRRYLAAQPGEYELRSTAAQPEDLLAVIYTSGTTGPPKGTMLSHHNAVWVLASLDSVLVADEIDRKLSFLPLSHVAERTASEYIQLQQGFEIWFSTGIENLGADFAACRPTNQFVVPRVLEKQYDGVQRMIEALPDEQRQMARQAIELGIRRTRLEQQGQQLPPALEAAWHQADAQLFTRIKTALGYDQLRALVSGAAPIAMSLLEFFRAIGVPLLEVYGQTEGHGPSTINRVGDYRLGTVGYAIPGGEVRLAEDGEILFRGENVCMGYYKEPEATAALIDDDGWMHSGDIGTIDDDGYLTITDRKKDIIITSGGKNIAPQVIEQKLKFSPYVSQAVVIGEGRPFVTALLTLDPAVASQPDIAEVIEKHVGEVNAELSQVEQVKRYVVLPEDFSVEANTITPTLKIKRGPIADRYAEEIASLYT